MSFSGRAAAWDTKARKERSRAIAKKIDELITGRERCSIMEYGCATGLVGLQIQHSFEKLMLVDSEPEMIEKAKENARISENNRIQFAKVDLLNEQAAIGKFDVIYTSLTLHHIKDVLEIIQVFYSLLKQNGMLCVIDLDVDDGSFHCDSADFEGYNGFEHSFIEHILIKTGFRRIQSETFFWGMKNDHPYSLFYAVGFKNS